MLYTVTSLLLSSILNCVWAHDTAPPHSIPAQAFKCKVDSDCELISVRGPVCAGADTAINKRFARRYARDPLLDSKLCQITKFRLVPREALCTDKRCELRIEEKMDATQLPGDRNRESL